MQWLKENSITEITNALLVWSITIQFTQTHRYRKNSRLKTRQRQSNMNVCVRNKEVQHAHILYECCNLIIVSSICFEHPSVHHLEDFYMQFYGISFLHPYKQSGRWQDVFHQTHVSNIQVFILRNTCTCSFMVFLSCIHISSLVDGRMCFIKTCFEHPSVYPHEYLYVQCYGIFYVSMWTHGRRFQEQ